MGRRAAVIAFLVAAALPATANAATVRIVNSYIPSTVHAIPDEPLAVITVLGGPESETIAIAGDGKTVTVTDSAPLQAGDGCASAPDGSVTCTANAVLRTAADGGDGDDTLTATGVGGMLGGGAGNDRLQGADVLVGGPGDDTLTGPGTASYADHESAVHVDLAHPEQQQGGPGEHDTLIGITGLLGTARDDVLAGAQTIEGGAGDDTLIAAAAGSTLYGGTGDDRLIGGSGDDTLAGWAGSDRLEGRGGDDELDAASVQETEFPPAGAFDRPGDRNVLRGGPGSDELSPGDGRDDLDGGPGRDEIGPYDSFPLLTPGDRVSARDGAADVIRCDQAVTALTLDRLDVPIHCGHRFHRIGVPRPAFTDPVSIDYDSGPAYVDFVLGCPGDMPRPCRLDVAARQDGKPAAHATWTVKPGHDTYFRNFAIRGRALTDARCRGRFALRFTVRTRDARGRPVTLRTTYRETIDRHPAECG